MNNRIDTVNGKEVTEFKKNTDYFEMSDGVFWTVEALMKKYDSGRSTIYNKARDNNIPTMRVIDTVCFKDSDKFTKGKPGGNVKSIEPHKLTSYAELHRKVEELIKTVRAATIPDLSDRERQSEDKLVGIETRLSVLKDLILDMNECVHNILDEMTKEKKDASK
jgi:hypothetical protein